MLPPVCVGLSLICKRALSKMKSQKFLEALDVAVRLSQITSGRLKSPTRTIEFLGFEWSISDRYNMISFSWRLSLQGGL